MVDVRTLRRGDVIAVRATVSVEAGHDPGAKPRVIAKTGGYESSIYVDDDLLVSLIAPKVEVGERVIVPHYGANPHQPREARILAVFEDGGVALAAVAVGLPGRREIVPLADIERLPPPMTEAELLRGLDELTGQKEAAE